MDAGKRQCGATLIEILTALGIVSILSAVAVPSFTGLQRDAARAATINDFIHSVFLARSEAIRRGVVIGICRSRDGRSCANKDPNWNGGWIVFENKDDDQPANTDPGEPVIFRHNALTSGTLTSNRDAFSFRSFNQGGVNGTLVYCPTRGSKEARAIIINHAGRPRSSKRDASGKPLIC